MTCDWCDTPLVSQRKGARFCGPDCRNRWHNEQRRKQSTTAKRLTSSRSHEDAPRTPSRPRRATRSGRGTKIYLTPEDLGDLELHLPHLSLPVAEKVKAARARIRAASE